MSISVGVLGSTGLVGQRLVARLEAHPWFDLVAVTASDSRVGERYGDSVTWRIDEAMPPSAHGLEIDATTPGALAGDPSLILSALPGSVATDVEVAFAETGALVCSNASPRRMDDDVPLIIPEVNADHLSIIERQQLERGWEGALVKNPNCMTTTIALPVAGLREFGLNEATVVTMQAISGAGTGGVHGIDIVDNVLPSIPGEASKLATEPRKLLGTVADGQVHEHDLDIQADCHRVPVVDGHLATVFVDLEDSPTATAAASAMAGLPDVELPSAPAEPVAVIDEPRRPQPRYDRDRERGMTVTVGPVESTDTGVRFTCLSHNTARGAAGACLLAAEAAVDAGYIA